MGYISDGLMVEETPRIGTVTVDLTPTPIPATPLAGRNGLLVRNAGDENVYLCNATGAEVFTLEPTDRMLFNTRDETALFYAKVAAGTGTLEIMEWR